MRGDSDATAFLKRIEDLELPLENPFVGAEHFFLVFLQRRRDESLAARDRLLAMVVARDRMQVRLRDLDVVAEDAVVANLEGVDARPSALGLLHLGDDLFAGTADAAQLVEFAIHAVPGEAAIARQGRRLVVERRFDPVANVHEIVQLGEQRPDERRLQVRQHGPEPRDDGERVLQADEIARARGAESGAGDEPLEILNGFDRVPELAAFGVVKRQFLDCVEAIANRLERDQRAEQPRSQETAADRRHGSIELVEQRSGAGALGSFENLQVLQRRRIDQQRVGALAVGHRPHVSEVDLLSLAQVMDERSGRGDGRWMTVEPETLEASRTQLVEERALCCRELERPVRDRGDGKARGDNRRNRRRRTAFSRRNDDLARAQHGELVGERLHPTGSGVFGGAELSRGQVEQRHANEAAGARRGLS